VAANWEEFLSYYLLLGVSRELVGNTDRQRIVFLNFKVGDFKQWAEHSS
jgi:hypothetical protein